MLATTRRTMNEDRVLQQQNLKHKKGLVKKEIISAIAQLSTRGKN